MANPLDQVTQDQSADDTGNPLKRVYIYGSDTSDGNGDPYRPQVINSPLAVAVAPEPQSDIMSLIAQVRDYLTGAGGAVNDTAKRFTNYDRQFTEDVLNLPRKVWQNPQKANEVGQRFITGDNWAANMAKSGATLPGDVMSGTEPIIDPETGRTSERVIERAQDMAGLAGGGALTERPGVGMLGSGPMRPKTAIDHPNFDVIRKSTREDGELVPGSHQIYNKNSAFDAHGVKATGPDAAIYVRNHLTGEDTAFPATTEGHQRAIKFWQENNKPVFEVYPRGTDYNGYHSPVATFRTKAEAQKWLDEHKDSGVAPGNMTLNSDTSKPGAAVAGLAGSGPAPVFYSALEHAATNAAQDVMAPQQWLGYLKNQPGVKAEELTWTGLPDWLAQQKGKVTKEDVKAYLDEHKVEIKDVTKKNNYGEGDDAVGNYVDEHYDRLRSEAEREVRRSDPELEHQDPSAHADAVEDAIAQIADDEMRGGVGGGGDVTKYSSYQLPGGENYREHLLTMPEKIPSYKPEELGKFDVRMSPDGKRFELYEKNTSGEDVYTGGGPTNGKNARQIQETIAGERGLEKAKAEANYSSNHWDEPNVLAHVRTNDRYMPSEAGTTQTIKRGSEAINREIDQLNTDLNDGKIVGKDYLSKYKTLIEELNAARDKESSGQPVEARNIKGVKSLHIEEIQSDWHQQGRKQGYKTQSGMQELDKLRDKSREGGLTGEEATRMAELAKIHTAVPDAPFKTTWPELALKRMIRHAAENGYDRISWTPGEAQAARYDLSKQVKLLSAQKIGDKYNVYIEGKDGQPLFRRGNGWSDHGQKTMTAEELEATVGKEPAKRIIEGKPNKEGWVDVRDEGLKVGGEGMREFYDKMLPKMAEKIGKAHGVKVQKGALPGPLSNKMGEPPLDHPVHYFDLPQSLKDHAVGKGFPLYMSGIPFPLTPVDHDPFAKKEKK